MAIWLAGSIACGLCNAVAAQTLAAPEPTPPATPAAAAAEGVGGMTVYIDPKTGAFLREPAPGFVPLQLNPQLQNALSTSHQGLVEVPASVPGGGIKLDLQGRFQSPLVVIIDANGKPSMQHLGEPPAVDDKP